jgi:hypothetical protein
MSICFSNQRFGYDPKELSHFAYIQQVTTDDIKKRYGGTAEITNVITNTEGNKRATEFNVHGVSYADYVPGRQINYTFYYDCFNGLVLENLTTGSITWQDPSCHWVKTEQIRD